MIPINQNNLTAGEGNCFSACVASILELSIDEVPNFLTESKGQTVKMWQLIGEWLNEHNWGMLSIMSPGSIKDMKAIWMQCHYVGLKGCLAIGTVRSQKIPGVLHGIVIGWKCDTPGRAWYNPIILHDPRPDNKPYDVMKDVIGLDLLLPIMMEEKKDG
ncbi:hypothetical protein LCGC14_2140680 [marine sediment metagenome]|uniref:Peptidase C39-like domain-containing protein n=1 Tax=marine sediment metagenome TaxID=412755 RepID=A0A0F9GUT7_9ZZZZ